MKTILEKQHFLSAVHVGVIAISRKGRTPVATPIWYDYAPGRSIRIWTPKDSAKARLIAAAGEFSFVVQDASPPYKFVRAEGPVMSITDATNEVVRDIASRYVSDEEVLNYIKLNEQTSYVIIEMMPNRLVGWAG